mmetsp:Transcript_35935/g.89438  ORF Transcript_35935/g.89438 Transcript_35935/m.89438 type:complete len:234 (+) Transcript_35935:691-1392(+)
MYFTGSFASWSAAFQTSSFDANFAMIRSMSFFILLLDALSSPSACSCEVNLFASHAFAIAKRTSCGMLIPSFWRNWSKSLSNSLAITAKSLTLSILSIATSTSLESICKSSSCEFSGRWGLSRLVSFCFARRLVSLFAASIAASISFPFSISSPAFSQISTGSMSMPFTLCASTPNLVARNATLKQHGWQRRQKSLTIAVDWMFDPINTTSSIAMTTKERILGIRLNSKLNIS